MFKYSICYQNTQISNFRYVFFYKGLINKIFLIELYFKCIKLCKSIENFFFIIFLQQKMSQHSLYHKSYRISDYWYIILIVVIHCKRYVFFIYSLQNMERNWKVFKPNFSKFTLHIIGSFGYLAISLTIWLIIGIKVMYQS